jgi:predicted metal-binding membrane protein
MRGVIGLVFWSAIGLVPLASGLVIASVSRRRDRVVALAPVAAFIGFLFGGVAGWTSLLPAQWTASFWTTVQAAGDSANYGESFEHMAERALMYFLYPAEFGAVVFGLAALLVLWRIPVPPVARPVR